MYLRLPQDPGPAANPVVEQLLQPSPRRAIKLDDLKNDWTGLMCVGSRCPDLYLQFIRGLLVTMDKAEDDRLKVCHENVPL